VTTRHQASNDFAVYTRTSATSDDRLGAVRGSAATRLLLLHGLSRNKRICGAPNSALAERLRGHAPDFRGPGARAWRPRLYDIAAYSIDCYTLVDDVLGHDTPRSAGGDVGGSALRPGLRYPGFATQQGVFNRFRPPLNEVVRSRGTPRGLVRAAAPNPTTSWGRQANDPKVCWPDRHARNGVRTLRSPACTATGLWGTPNAFTAEEVAFPHRRTRDEQTRSLRASWCGWYEQDAGARRWRTFRACSNKRRYRRSLLYGPDDHGRPAVIQSGRPAAA